MVMVETYMLVDRIQTISASIINRKLASYLWLRNREDVREKLLRSLRVVEVKEEESILVRECKARLGERETLTSPAVRVLRLDGEGSCDLADAGGVGEDEWGPRHTR